MKLLLPGKPVPRAGLLKLLFLMRLTAMLILITSLHVTANTFSQKVSISGNKLSLQSVFESIEKQTGYQFIYSSEILQEGKLLDLDFKNSELNEVLTTCLEKQNLRFEIRKKIIVVKPVKLVRLLKHPALDPNPPITIRGRIVNEKGEPVIASIIIKGTKAGTTSDYNGEFYLKGIDDNAVLIITAANIERLEISLAQDGSKPMEDGTITIPIIVKMNTSPLEEIVFKGYYSSSKRLNTGSVSKVSAVDIEKQPVLNPMQALQGRMPGVQITQSSGVPGAGIDIIIRGRNSLRRSFDPGGDGSKPLYIVDGVPFTSTSLTSPTISSGILSNASPFSIFSPSDIESIEILKDADATAIYGSRGANGVVLISTKKGKAGKAKIDILASYGIGKITRRINLLNTPQYIELRKEAYANDGIELDPANVYAPDLFFWDQQKYTDWQNELIGKKSNSSIVQFSLSGGNANTKYLFGGSYYRETTVFPGELFYKRANANFNIAHTSDDQKFTAQFSANIGLEKNNLFKNDLTQFITLPPNAPSLYDSVGKLNWENGTFNNPLSYLLKKYNANTNSFVGNATIGYEILPGLHLKSNFGYTRMDRNELQTNPLSSFNPALNYTRSNTYSHFGDNDIQTWIIEPQINWRKNIGQGRLSVLLGTSLQENVASMYTVKATGFSNDALMENIASASAVTVDNSNYSKYRYGAFFGRVNYDFSLKYILNLTARRDGSSRFGPEKKFANFGAIGVAWVFSNEHFVKNNLNFLSYGKIRSSYGTSGSDQIEDYGFMELWRSTAYPYEQRAGLYPERISNRDFAWEKNRKFEIALEAGFLKDHLLLTMSYYKNVSSNQLVGLPLPPSTGFLSIQANLAATVRNTGFEIEVLSKNVQKNYFSWSTSFNISIPKNSLVSFPNLQGSVYSDIYIIGQPLSVYKSLHVTGVNTETGVYEFEDYNKNGTPMEYPDDVQGLKKITQDYYGGLINAFKYKRWELEFLVQFVKQTGTNYIRNTAVPGEYINQPSVVMNRWRSPGDISDIPKASTFSLEYLYAQTFGDITVSDASFLRLKNIHLSYKIPIPSSQKKGLQTAEIFISGQNLLTLSNFLGLDPESQNYLTLPPLSTLAVGFKLEF